MIRQPRSGWQRNHKMVEIERYKMHICLGNLGVGGRESPRWWALINIRCIYAKAT